MGRIVDMIQEKVPGVYVKSLEIGPNMIDDLVNGFFMNINKQVDMVCEQLRQDPKLRNGFHAVGFSQGGQFLRGYVERCNTPRVLNLVTLGGQHQGVFGLPNCPGPNITLCETARELIDYAVYDPWIQSFQVQAEYWHDPLDEALYLSNSAYIADINNARPLKNATYKANLASLKNFVMVMFSEDTVVIPRESSWFGFYEPGQDRIITPLRKSKIYIEDWLGLRSLDAAGRLHFLSTVGNHLQFTDSWFEQIIIKQFLS